jgi:hypothetical protein
LSEVYQRLQIDFDRTLCSVLEKYHSFPGFTLLLVQGSLGNFLWQRSQGRQHHIFSPGMVATFYLVRQQGNGHILDDIGFSGILLFNAEKPGTREFLIYLALLLHNPERSGAGFFDQQRYMIAAKECLELYLCSHHKFSKGTTEFTHHDQELRRNKPFMWKAQLGVKSRIHKVRHHIKLLKYKSLKTRIFSHQGSFFSKKSPDHEYYRSLTYQWALDLLPVLLGESVISCDLANMLHRRTFTTMAQRFPKRSRWANEAIMKYLLRVESAMEL